jgi:hypothetical protein
MHEKEINVYLQELMVVIEEHFVEKVELAI